MPEIAASVCLANAGGPTGTDLMQALTDAVLAVDTSGQVVYANAAARAWFAPPGSETPWPAPRSTDPSAHTRSNSAASPAVPALAFCLAPGSPSGQLLVRTLTACRLAGLAVQAAEPLRLPDLPLDPMPDPLPDLPSDPPDLRPDPPNLAVLPSDGAASAPWTAAPRHLRLVASPAGADLVLLAFSDIGDAVASRERLLHDVRHDPLTGLPNRILLAERLDELIGRRRRVALLFIDLDRFSRINEALGVRHGDAVLHAVAARLVEACPPGADVGRWGGDEFVVLLDDQTPAQALRGVAERLLGAVAASQQVDALTLQCTCSIGMASTLTDAAEPEMLVAAAESGMRRAKALGGARCEWPATSRPAWTREVLVLEERLRLTIGTGGFVLHYQPQIDLRTSRPVGLEALLRWRQCNGELWSPGRFLNVAEESGAILAIGAWVLREAVDQMMRWRAQGLPALPVSVNVSARQCLDRHLVELVGQVLADTGLPAELLKLEITETTAMSDVEQVRVLLGELRAIGVGVSVDDFGTGYSSFAHLTRLPIDQIKIDQSFVHDVEQGPNGAAIVRATIKLAHELGVPVVAEGVESAGQMRFLADHACDIAQGYFCSHPLAPDAAERWLRAAALS